MGSFGRPSRVWATFRGSIWDPDKQCLDRHGPDSPDRHDPERYDPGRKGPDRQHPDRQAPDRQGPDIHSEPFPLQFSMFAESFFPSFPSLFTACHGMHASVRWLVKAMTKPVEPPRRQPKQWRRADLRVGTWKKSKDRPTQSFPYYTAGGRAPLRVLFQKRI